MNILIPDDYQGAAAAMSCLQMMAEHKVTCLGDLTREKQPDAILAQTECLVLIRERTPVDKALLGKMPNLRMISQTGPAGRHIDIEACTAAGVVVMEGIGSPYAPAELAWLLIMSGFRRLHEAVTAFQDGQWQVNSGRELHGRTLGILGFGKLGKRVAGFAQAFGMQVQVWGSERARAEAIKAGHKACEARNAFFASSDVITLHLRLADQTRGAITFEDLSRMKPESMLVNTSRAELIAPGALERALLLGRPGYAAVDVYESEPVYHRQHPLMQLPNVLCTPHLGYVAEQSYDTYLRSAFGNILRFLSGDHSMVLNPGGLNKSG